MPSSAKSSFGTLLKIGDGGGSEVFTTIAEVKDIGGPELGANTADVTNHSSTGGWEEKVATILKGGQVTFDLNFLPTNATQSASTGLIADMVARTKRNFKIVFPDGSTTTWTFAAFVTKFSPSSPVDGAMTASVTLDITGQPTLT